jgi:hypothetical protein
MSESSENYKLILSFPFKTTLPLEGTLLGNHSLQIPLYIDPLFYTNKETVNYMALGFFQLTIEAYVWFISNLKIRTWMYVNYMVLLVN